MDLGQRLVRLALLRLAEDPPLALGDTDLATLLLSDEPDRMVRGMRMKEGLRQAIEALRMPGDDRRFLIFQGEYVEGRQRETIRRNLHISDSSYTRAKRGGLERITGLLPYILAQQQRVRVVGESG